MTNLVVCHYLDGRLVKGRCFDFTPTKPVCRVQTGATTLEVRLADLKALFVVRDLAGNPGYAERQDAVPGDPRRVGARLLEIRFRDGETLVGFVTAYSDERPFFFLLPADPRSNNVRVLVNRAAVAAIRDAGPPQAPGPA